MRYERLLDLPALLKKKSFFLFGPRATGKSFLIREQLGASALVIDLLQSSVYLKLSAHPEEIESLIDAHQNVQFIVIDEIQRIP